MCHKYNKCKTLYINRYWMERPVISGNHDLRYYTGYDMIRGKTERLGFSLTNL